MNAKEITEHYYTNWMGKDENLFAGQCAPVKLIYTTERNIETPGYGCRFDIWALETEKGAFVSYGDKARGQIHELEAMLGGGSSLKEALQAVYKVEPGHSFKYVYAGKSLDASSAKVLDTEDYPAYEQFFLACNPHVRDVSWLMDYFTDMASKRLCCGVFADGMLVSCTDAPTVPYMQDSVAEIGINTVEGYRGNGYARMACARCIQEILIQDKCPLWSTGADNAASRRLAESLGFIKFGDAYSLSVS